MQDSLILKLENLLVPLYLRLINEDSPIESDRQPLADIYFIRMFFCYINSMNALMIERFTKENILNKFESFPSQLTIIGRIKCLQLCLASLILLEDNMKMRLKEKIKESGCFIGLREMSKILVENLKIECQKEENEEIYNDLIILAKFYSKVDSDSAQIIFGEKMDSDPDKKIIKMVEELIAR